MGDRFERTQKSTLVIYAPSNKLPREIHVSLYDGYYLIRQWNKRPLQYVYYGVHPGTTPLCR